jgi:hypothetical protein
MMEICLAGWYFHEPLLKMLDSSKHPSFIVMHKEHKVEIPSVVIANIGLEFGCYNWYVKNKWAGGDTLLMHDDNEVTEQTLDAIGTINRDQCFLFTSEEEGKANGYAHGRAMFCSARFMQKMKDDGMPWFDEGNKGNVDPTTATEPNYHNSGIQVFRSYLGTFPKDWTVNRMAVVPGLKCGYRGRI